VLPLMPVAIVFPRKTLSANLAFDFVSRTLLIRQMSRLVPSEVFRVQEALFACEARFRPFCVRDVLALMLPVRGQYNRCTGCFVNTCLKGDKDFQRFPTHAGSSQL